MSISVGFGAIESPWPHAWAHYWCPKGSWPSGVRGPIIPKYTKAPQTQINLIKHTSTVVYRGGESIFESSDAIGPHWVSPWYI